MQGEFAITIDIDWSPDFVIDSVAQQLGNAGVTATWFVTHGSPAVNRLRGNRELFELGIHPNFLPGSSHGKTPEEILGYVMSIVPDALSSRSHAVVQSGPLLDQLVRDTPIRVDSSQFLPEMPHIQPINHLTPHGILRRVPFFWTDDYEMMRAPANWTLNRFIGTPGLKVFVFHPIHIYLNTPDSHLYWRLRGFGNRLNEMTKEQIDPHVFQGNGTATIFRELIGVLAKGNKGQTIKALADVGRELA